MKNNNLVNKILIANRGEIAIRVIRACRQLNIPNVAVYSDIDSGAVHVRLADEAYLIGEAPSNKSYLLGDKLIEVAKKSGADAIHPGYGFLAENWQFSKQVTDAGLTFIGPGYKSIQQLGDKLQAREMMIKAGVPVVPGGKASGDDLPKAKEIAKECGYPVLVKAVAGGGGKGMRVVNSEKELKGALETASSEAKSAFGDARVYIEKYLENPRHIEIQIARDSHGNTVYLGERECSIQRRHQKLIEEAPSVLVDEKMRKKMGTVAVKAVDAADYLNCGTVEFLVDQNMDYYFLEVNTRLQVEHPVTELVTGIDLVKEQISIARGNKLTFMQDDITINGHAIECRICAEDCEAGFLPSTGTLLTYHEPAGPGVRVDSGVRENTEISPYYDPLMAKLITHGATRDEAINRMRAALSEYRICGVSSNIEFHEAVMNQEAWQSGNISTSYINEHYPNGFESKVPDEQTTTAVAVAAALFNYFDSKRLKQVDNSGTTKNRWLETGRMRGVGRLPGGSW